MSVANPTRMERVRDLLIAAYEGITTAGGYRQEIGNGNVTGSYLDIRDNNKFPII